jgi:hypothetical protein
VRFESSVVDGNFPSHIHWLFLLPFAALYGGFMQTYLTQLKFPDLQREADVPLP